MFYTPNNLVRPVRLCKDTRRFAYDSLKCKYGLEALQTPAVSLDDIEGYDALSAIEKYDVAILRIAQDAPIRICDGEKIIYPDKIAFWPILSG